ncbi:phage major capsid protein [Nonomuraea angiospora]|uniref:phage major capsid protein n=1 Tax=Nonomuraea angiospora TaxID=46172 RepID=UPI0029A66F92|nr:phage major capsid protein [Nonomuraea angiospora]MDX3101744.1 phage major capsid protein [Nonomuraea angiospora]
MSIDAPERVIEFPALREAQAELDAKRKSLKGIFDEAGPEYDMSKVKSIQGDTHAKVDFIRQLNAEIDERKSKVDELLVIARAAGAAKEAEQAETGDRDVKDDGREPRTKDGRARSFGELFTGSQAFKGFVRGSGVGPQAQLNITLKSLLSTAGWQPETTRTGHIEQFATRPAPHIADLIPQTTTGQAAVVYMEETVYQNSAAEVNEGDQFPEAALKLEEKSSPVRKIAVYLPVTDELFEDEPRAESYVQNRLPFMIRQRLDLQILRGNGTAPNLVGTQNVAGILSQPLGGDPVPDALYKAMRRIRDTGFAEPSVVFITPAKWEPVRLLRTSDGVYIWGHPSAVGPMTIWGVPVVETVAAPPTSALLGDYANFAELSVRRGIDVQVSNSHDDFFIRGKLAIRADIRCALIHYRPSAFAEVTGLV